MILISEENFIREPKNILLNLKKGKEPVNISGRDGNFLLLNMDDIQNLEDVMDLQLIQATRGEETLPLSDYLPS